LRRLAQQADDWVGLTTEEWTSIDLDGLKNRGADRGNPLRRFVKGGRGRELVGVVGILSRLGLVLVGRLVNNWRLALLSFLPRKKIKEEG
jgi:hypothetical protein